MSPIIKNPDLYGLLNETRLADFEINLGVRLPEDYRKFLMDHNGGIPEPSTFWIKDGIDSSEVFQFYGIHDGPEWLSLENYIIGKNFGIPEHLLAIGDDGTGNTICLGISGNKKGVVYFIDHEIHPFEEPNSYTGVTRIADSFTQFISQLFDVFG